MRLYCILSQGHETVTFSLKTAGSIIVALMESKELIGHSQLDIAYSISCTFVLLVLFGPPLRQPIRQLSPEDNPFG
jgi:hypothetical protein